MRERDGRTCAVSLTAQSVSVRSLEVNSYSAAEKQQPVFTEKNCIKTNENIRIMNWSYVKKFKVTFALVFCVWLLLECCVWGNFEVCGEESRWPVFVASKLTLNLIEVLLKVAKSTSYWLESSRCHGTVRWAWELTERDLDRWYSHGNAILVFFCSSASFSQLNQKYTYVKRI